MLNARDYFAGIYFKGMLKLESHHLSSFVKDGEEKDPLGLILGRRCYEMADLILQASKEKKVVTKSPRTKNVDKNK